MKNNYRLSILLVTFNQEKFIHQGLTSIFNQFLEEKIELVIADDGSQDNTLAIIREFEGKDSRFDFKYLDNSINLGITKNYQRGFAACSGEYVAVLEGDDYWVSPYKLKKQLDFLENHWECNLCSVNYFVYRQERAEFFPRTAVGLNYRLITARNQIADNLASNFSTCMYRRAALEALPQQLFELTSYDWIVNICIGQYSLIGFLEEPMSVYRVHNDGTWTQSSNIEKLETQLSLIPAYNSLTEYVFNAEFEELQKNLQYSIQVSKLKLPREGRAIRKLLEYSPPLLLTVTRALIPPALIRFIKKINAKN